MFRREPAPENGLGWAAVAQLVRAAKRDHPPVAQHGDPVGEALGLLDVVGGQQDRGARPAQVVDQVPGVMPGRRVEARGRLVEEQQIGRADDAEGEVQATALTRRRVP